MQLTLWSEGKITGNFDFCEIDISLNRPPMTIRPMPSNTGVSLSTVIHFLTLSYRWRTRNSLSKLKKNVHKMQAAAFFVSKYDWTSDWQLGSQIFQHMLKPGHSPLQPTVAQMVCYQSYHGMLRCIVICRHCIILTFQLSVLDFKVANRHLIHCDLLAIYISNVAEIPCFRNIIRRA